MQQIPAAAAAQAGDESATLVRFSHLEKVSPTAAHTGAPPTTTPFQVS